MRNRRIIKNPGLLLISLIASFLLWVVVVNVDDPVINKTYSGIQVEILNENDIAKDGKCYEIINNSDTISVTVSAKRSVIDDMSRDYIKATADIRNVTSAGTVPIEVKATRFSDKIESVTTKSENVRLKIENVVEKTLNLMVRPEGEVASGYVLSSVTPKINEVVISGPESAVEKISHAEITVPIDDLSADESMNVPVKLIDSDNSIFTDASVTTDVTDISVNIVIYATKKIPVTYVATGRPADGYSTNGKVTIEPESLLITGRSAYLSSMTSIAIPSDSISLTGATSDVTAEVNLNDYLPDGISFVDGDYDGRAVITIGIEANDVKTITVPLSNITVTNVPDGYKASIVDIGASFQMDVQGKGDTFLRYDGTYALGTIDALNLTPRNATGEDLEINTGSNDGKIIFQFPNGVSEVTPVYLEVIIEKIQETTE